MGNSDSHPPIPPGSLVKMWPSEILFTHDSISPTFQDGQLLTETYDDIVYKRLDPSTSCIRPLVVTYHNGNWWVVRGKLNFDPNPLLFEVSWTLAHPPLQSTHAWWRPMATENRGSNTLIQVLQEPHCMPVELLDTILSLTRFRISLLHFSYTAIGKYFAITVPFKT